MPAAAAPGGDDDFSVFWARGDTREQDEAILHSIARAKGRE